MVAIFTDDTFQADVLENDIPVLVDFWATWCGPCQMMSPVIEALSTEMEGKIKVGKLNVDENSATAQKYGIMSIPALKVYKNGEIVEELVGAMSKEDLLVKLTPHIG